MSFFGSTDPYLEISKGNVPGTTNGFIVGVNKNLSATNTRTVWDVDEDYVFLTADTQLYISSSSTSDTSVLVVVTGLDANYNEITRTVTTNGQTQVALSGLMFRVNVAVVAGTPSPVGDLYIAETDTLTTGVPDDLTKVKAKIPLSATAGEPAGFVSDNISHNGVYTVPAGKTFFGLEVRGFAGKNQDLTFSGRVRLLGGSWLNRSPSPLYQGVALQEFDNRLSVPEKTDFEFRAIAGTDGYEFQFQFQFVLVDN